MYTFEKHYTDLLAPYYTRVYGGREQNYRRAREILIEFGLNPDVRNGPGNAADLGAGSGFYSVPLADMGYSVVAIDLDETLVDELRQNAKGFSISLHLEDMLQFQKHCTEPLDLVVCMTDTIAHLNSMTEIQLLFDSVQKSLHNEGLFLISFRDQSQDLTGPQRFIPFYSDDSLIATTFVEFQPAHVDVTDLLYIRDTDGWQMKVSSYSKLRLRTEEIKQCLQAGFTLVSEKNLSGMTYILCRKTSETRSEFGISEH
ncbi:MAG: SAM-dependent methyltransferase [Leptospiraceae bacterium]|nr:SAM-dependent methyltransferase [Leptospiraceae bacterium]